MSTLARRIEERDSDAARMGDALLDIAEQAVRACVEVGAGVAIEMRLDRVLGRQQAAGNGQRDGAGPSLDAMQLTMVLGALKDARATGRLRGAAIANNMAARKVVLDALRAMQDEVAA